MPFRRFSLEAQSELLLLNGKSVVNIINYSLQTAGLCIKLRLPDVQNARRLLRANLNRHQPHYTRELLPAEGSDAGDNMSTLPGASNGILKHTVHLVPMR